MVDGYHAMWTDAEWGAARGITVRQPWTWAIAEGADWPETAKGVENRSAGFPKGYRGPLLIHAGTAWSARGAADERILSLWVQGTTHGDVGPLNRDWFGVGGPSRVFGAVVAVAELADIHPDAGCCRPWGESEYVGSDQQLHRGVTHLVLENVVQLIQPAQHRGALGLWRAPEALLHEVGRQVGRGQP